MVSPAKHGSEMSDGSPGTASLRSGDAAAANTSVEIVKPAHVEAKSFYNREFTGDRYTPFDKAESHSAYPSLKAFIDRYDLSNKRVLEVGCGRGAFQDLVEDYTGVDFASTVAKKLHKPFFEASATALPFERDSFDATWTIWVLEHVPDPERAFVELRRVLKPGGLLYLAPAWNCRAWFADGYPVRSYSEFGLKGKLIKASLLVRERLVWRLLWALPRRALRAAGLFFNRQPTRFRYRTLKPNYETFWMSDSDATNSMDPYEALMWFVSRGDECLNCTGRLRQLLFRGGPLIFRIHKDNES